MRKSVEYFLFLVPTVEDLPAPVAEIVGEAGFPPQTILIVPPQEYPIFHQYRFFSMTYGQRTTPRRTLVFGADRLLVIEQEAALRQIVIPYEALVSLDLAIVLLYAYISFTWRAHDRFETLKVEYNAVGESFIRAEAQRIRQTRPPLPLAAPDATEAILRALPLKFRNYLRFSLFGGEQVFSAVYQPAIEYPRRTLRPRLSGDRTVALTSAGMTVLEEEASRVLNYGLTTRCFPLSSLDRVDFEPQPDFTWMRLSLPAQDTRIPLSHANADAIHQALGRFLPSVPLSMGAATFAPAGVP